MESTTNNNSIRIKDNDDHFIIFVLQKFIYILINHYLENHLMIYIMR